MAFGARRVYPNDTRPRVAIGVNNPTFGAGLREYIFRNINQQNFDFIEDDLQNKIDQNFDNIQVESIEVTRNVNENTINVGLTYSIPNTGINDELELNFG